MWAVVVAHLAECLLLTPDDLDFNPVISNLSEQLFSVNVTLNKMRSGNLVTLMRLKYTKQCVDKCDTHDLETV